MWADGTQPAWRYPLAAVDSLRTCAPWRCGLRVGGVACRQWPTAGGAARRRGRRGAEACWGRELGGTRWPGWAVRRPSPERYTRDGSSFSVSTHTHETKQRRGEEWSLEWSQSMETNTSGIARQSERCSPPPLKRPCLCQPYCLVSCKIWPLRQHILLLSFRARVGCMSAHYLDLAY